MSKIIAVHSFRGGTGKSNTAANLATIMASQGLRVGVIDTDIQSPGIHVLFGLSTHDIHYTLNDYLWGTCNIESAAYDVTPKPKEDETFPGKIFLVPSSSRLADIARIIEKGYDTNLLSGGYQDLISELDLELLIVDTHPGLNEETLFSIALSDILIVIIRPDQQDYQGASVTVEVARRLRVQRLLMMVNQIPPNTDIEDLKAQAEEIYKCEVIAMIPYSPDMLVLGSEGLFVREHPTHPVSLELYKAVGLLMQEERGPAAE
jgi:septum site-determining protein MinD